MEILGKMHRPAVDEDLPPLRVPGHHRTGHGGGDVLLSAGAQTQLFGVVEHEVPRPHLVHPVEPVQDAAARGVPHRDFQVPEAPLRQPALQGAQGLDGFPEDTPHRLGGGGRIGVPGVGQKPPEFQPRRIEPGESGSTRVFY
ncbi:MAG: hypothetical protein BWY80_01500 [Firmicutes bacterium ADurb.Bin456]|nr:MAG: hypothetical protein BWY80_01500 [Firmicutes bacterium ADurb.Bin456]